jgi:hypothetical protein
MTECPAHPGPRKEKGNALFLILIAVALFAALSYVVTQSGRGGGSINREQAQIVASQLVQYAGALQQAIQRLILTGGCTIGAGEGLPSRGTVSFHSTQFIDPTLYDNNGAPADKSCHIFDAAGGGVVFQAPPTLAQGTGGTEYIISGSLRVDGVGSDVQGDGQELTLIARIPRDICLTVNRLERITNPSGDAPEATGMGAHTFPPSDFNAMGDGFGNTSCVGCFGQTQELLGKWTGCYKSSTDSNYYFYSVLYPR